MDAPKNGNIPHSPAPSIEETASSSFDEYSLDYGSDADADNIKSSLEQFLLGVKATGSFATSGVAPTSHCPASRFGVWDPLAFLSKNKMRGPLLEHAIRHLLEKVLLKPELRFTVFSYVRFERCR